MEKITIELTFKKKELRAILRMLTKIAEKGYEGINWGALELAIQEVEDLLDRMKNGGRSIATVTLEVAKSDFEQIQMLFEQMSPEDDPADITKDIHEILDGDGDEKEPFPKEETFVKTPPELPRAPVYKPEPAKVPIKKEPAKVAVAGFNYIPGTEMAIRPSRFLRYLK